MQPSESTRVGTSTLRPRAMRERRTLARRPPAPPLGVYRRLSFIAVCPFPGVLWPCWAAREEPRRPQGGPKPILSCRRHTGPKERSLAVAATWRARAPRAVGGAPPPAAPASSAARLQAALKVCLGTGRGHSGSLRKSPVCRRRSNTERVTPATRAQSSAGVDTPVIAGAPREARLPDSPLLHQQSSRLDSAGWPARRLARGPAHWGKGRTKFAARQSPTVRRRAGRVRCYSVGVVFEPGFRAKAQSGAPCLVVRVLGDAVAVHEGDLPENAHFLGTLDGQPCVAVDDEGTSGAGEGFVGLRQLWGQVGEQLWGVAGRAVQISGLGPHAPLLWPLRTADRTCARRARPAVPGLRAGRPPSPGAGRDSACRAPRRQGAFGPEPELPRGLLLLFGGLRRAGRDPGGGGEAGGERGGGRRGTRPRLFREPTLAFPSLAHDRLHRPVLIGRGAPRRPGDRRGCLVLVDGAARAARRNEHRPGPDRGLARTRP